MARSLYPILFAYSKKLEPNFAIHKSDSHIPTSLISHVLFPQITVPLLKTTVKDDVNKTSDNQGGTAGQRACLK